MHHALCSQAEDAVVAKERESMASESESKSLQSSLLILKILMEMFLLTRAFLQQALLIILTLSSFIELVGELMRTSPHSSPSSHPHRTHTTPSPTHTNPSPPAVTTT